jgi:phosphotransferase system enzyme I (PtsI)
VYIWPSEATIDRYRIDRGSVAGIPKENPVREPIPEMRIFANINLSQDVEEAVAQKAEGIGLYRTEFEFLAEGRLLTEEEQFVRYVRVIKAMDGKPVYFRLLDIGGDKEADFFALPRESNPYLGFRGSRLLLARPDLLYPQVRALARASAYGPVYMLYPMIIDLKQFITLRARIIAEINGITTGELKHGVMFEVPSACLEASEILAEADFASVGSNDLIQYLFAVDRNNEYVAYDYTPERKVFWSLLERIIGASERLSKSVSVCGEIAGSREHIVRLLEIGIKSVSVSARFISDLRSHINSRRIRTGR